MTKRNLSPEAIEKMRQGGRNRAKAFTSEYQQQTRSMLPHEACVKAGKAAYKKLVEKYGVEYAQDKAAEWRLYHPSSLELIVMDWLQDVEHEREPKIRLEDNSFYYVDFKIGKTLIEVNGAWVHSLRVDKDNRKYEALATAGYTVIVLPESDIRSGKAKDIIDRLFKES